MYILGQSNAFLASEYASCGGHGCGLAPCGPIRAHTRGAAAGAAGCYRGVHAVYRAHRKPRSCPAPERTQRLRSSGGRNSIVGCQPSGVLSLLPLGLEIFQQRQEEESYSADDRMAVRRRATTRHQSSASPQSQYALLKRTLTNG